MIAAVILVCGANHASAFTSSKLSSCAKDPNPCVERNPNPTADLDPSGIEKTDFIKQSVKLVIFGTNRVVSKKPSSDYLYKISSRFSDVTSDKLTVGAVERTINPNNGKIIINISKYTEFTHQSDFQIFLKTHNSGRFLDRGLLFVHGVNNDFGSAIQSASTISDLKSNDIMPFVFSWPSRKWGFPSRRDYDHDVVRNEESIPALEAFAERLAFHGIRSLDILAHSRGAYLVSRFLDRFFGWPRTGYKISSVTFAAPDVPAQIFYDLFRHVKLSSSFAISVYISKVDRVITISELKNISKNVREDIRSEWPMVDFIDVAETHSFLGHDFYISNDAVGEDFRDFIKSRRRASARSAVEPTDLSINLFRIKIPTLKP